VLYAPETAVGETVVDIVRHDLPQVGIRVTAEGWAAHSTPRSAEASLARST
jgi:hypothetical protein